MLSQMYGIHTMNCYFRIFYYRANDFYYFEHLSKKSDRADERRHAPKWARTNKQAKSAMPFTFDRFIAPFFFCTVCMSQILQSIAIEHVVHTQTNTNAHKTQIIWVTYLKHCISWYKAWSCKVSFHIQRSFTHSLQLFTAVFTHFQYAWNALRCYYVGTVKMHSHLIEQQ